mmetsp:Transcript_13532/g.34911  ORF Transcript_13532/g.34911 Transcript_13532/m.34911 type:complete len:261 (+) Transcript_13532:113-895(+)
MMNDFLKSCERLSVFNSKSPLPQSPPPRLRWASRPPWLPQSPPRVSWVRPSSGILRPRRWRVLLLPRWRWCPSAASGFAARASLACLRRGRPFPRNPRPSPPRKTGRSSRQRSCLQRAWPPPARNSWRSDPPAAAPFAATQAAARSKARRLPPPPPRRHRQPPRRRPQISPSSASQALASQRELPAVRWHPLAPFEAAQAPASLQAALPPPGESFAAAPDPFSSQCRRCPRPPLSPSSASPALASQGELPAVRSHPLAPS